MAEEVVNLMDLAGEEAPEELKPEGYFDFDAHPFEHRALFDRSNSVCQAIRRIHDYVVEWLEHAVAERRSAPGNEMTAAEPPGHARSSGQFEVLADEGAVFEPRSVTGPDEGTGAILLGKGAKLVGCDIYLDKGNISVGEGTQVEAGVGLKGPTVIGSDCEIRQGAYLRGDCILGNGCTIRGELKNTVLMDKANFPHPSYLGDSICGYMTHFGNQATAANLGIYEGLVPSEKRRNLRLRIGEKLYDIGSPKMGVCMGDYCQVGCNSCTDPGTFLRPHTIAYTLTRIPKGFHGPNLVLKNKPMEHGIIEKATLRPL